jgi:nicotinate-nucleotide adenylyltransferase
MLELALEDNSRFEISRLDIERAGWSYTSETLRLLRAQLPAGTQIHFLMGQDSLRDFPNWHQPGEIARQVRLGVALRPGVEASIEVVNRAVPETIGVIDLVPVPLIGVSSREIRERVRDGKTIRYLVLPAVADYVALHGLYRDEPGQPDVDTEALPPVH